MTMETVGLYNKRLLYGDKGICKSTFYTHGSYSNYLLVMNQP